MDILFRSGIQLVHGDSSGTVVVDTAEIPDLPRSATTHNLWVLGSGRIYAIVAEDNEPLYTANMNVNENGGAADTIDDNGVNAFLTEGFKAGQTVNLAGSGVGNNGDYTIITAAADLLTFSIGDFTADEFAMIQLSGELRTAENVNLYYSDDSGDTWSAPQTANTTTFYGVKCVAACVDSDESVHICWIGQTTTPAAGVKKLYYRKWDGSAMVGGSDTYQTVFSDSAVTNYCDIAVNDSDDIMIVKGVGTTVQSSLNFAATATVTTSKESGDNMALESLGSDFHCICRSSTSVGGGAHHYLRHDKYDGSWSNVNTDVPGGGWGTGVETWAVMKSDGKLQIAVQKTLAPQSIYFREYETSWGTLETVIAGNYDRLSIGYRPV